MFRKIAGPIATAALAGAAIVSLAYNLVADYGSRHSTVDEMPEEYQGAVLTAKLIHMPIPAPTKAAVREFWLDAEHRLRSFDATPTEPYPPGFKESQGR